MDVWTIVGVVFCVACIIGTFVYYGCISIEPQEKSIDKTNPPTITLPCNAGDVVWFETYSDKGINGGLKPHEVLDFKVYAVVSSDRGYPCDIDISEFGKTVFLTKKGANTNEK